MSVGERLLGLIKRPEFDLHVEIAAWDYSDEEEAQKKNIPPGQYLSVGPLPLEAAQHKDFFPKIYQELLITLYQSDFVFEGDDVIQPEEFSLKPYGYSKDSYLLIKIERSSSEEA